MTERGRGMILPVAALLAVAGAMGLLLGFRALPPGETEIIDAVAAEYVAETGGTATDCAARPGARAEVRLVVNCYGAGPVWSRAVDTMGNPVGDGSAVPRPPGT